MNNIFREYYEIFIDKKKFVYIYVLALLLLTLGMFNRNNFLQPKTEIVFFVLSVVLGIFLILYSFKNKDSLHKVAFLTILIVGGLIVFFAPPFIVPDEYFHINYTLNMLDGHFFLENAKVISGKVRVWSNVFYWPLLQSYDYLFKVDPGIGAFIFNNKVAFTPISNFTDICVYSRTTSGPFYAYIFSAIGLFIAKFFDVGLIQAMWLSRIPNLIVYAIATFFAIKKVPAYKMGLLVVACNPLILSLAASSNYDSFNFTCLIIAMALFISMYKNKVTVKNLSGFIICCLLMGFVKELYFFIAILLFLIPFKNYNFKKISQKQYKKILVCIIAIVLLGMIMIICLCCFNVISIGINENQRLINIFTNPALSLDLFTHSITFLKNLIINTPGYREYLVGTFKGVELYNVLYFIFFIAFSVLYPFKIKLSKNRKIFLGLCCVAFYFGMFFMIHILWGTPVSYFDTLVQPRYFIPLLPLIPLVLNYPIKNIKNIEYYTLTGVIIFSVGFLMFLATHFY